MNETKGTGVDEIRRERRSVPNKPKEEVNALTRGTPGLS